MRSLLGSAGLSLISRQRCSDHSSEWKEIEAMALTSHFKIFFVNDALQAEFCMERIRAFHPTLISQTFSDLTDCILRLGAWLQNGDLLWFNLHFFDETVMALPTFKMGHSLRVCFVVDQDISGIALDIVKIPDVSQGVSSLVFAQPYSTVLSGFYSGIEFRHRPKKFIKYLLEKIQVLDLMKSILPMTRDYPCLEELIDSCFTKLLECIKGKSGVLRLRHRDTLKDIFFKEYGAQSLNKVVDQLPESDQHKIVIGSISQIAGEGLAQEIRSLGVKTSICGFIESKFSEGYFTINTVHERIGQSDMAVLELFRTQIGRFLDNTLYFQELLKRLNLDVSLVKAPEKAVMVVDSERRVVDINLVAERLTGWKKKDALGRRCSELWQSCDYFGSPMCNTSRCPMQRTLKWHENIMGKEVRYVKKGGERRVATSDYILDFDSASQISHGVAIVKDVTDRVNLQERFYRLEQMARLGNFASELAHEIRNPVTGISSSAQYLYENPDVSEEHKRILEEILIGAHILERTVKKYLGFARSAEPRLQRCELNHVIGEVCKFLAAKMEEQGITLETEFAEGLPAIFADVDQIQQVYVNVILNAMEAMTERGRIGIRTYLEKTETSAMQSQPDWVVSVVRDEGHGIRLCDTEKIFDAFFTTKSAGSGLGLYTSYNILRKHNAEIRVFSEVDVGTEVIIRFPVETGGSEEGTAKTWPPGHSSPE